MTRTRTAILAAVALAATALVPPSSAGAKQSDSPLGGSDGDKTVEVSTSGSYIVVMNADPLIVEFDVEDLDTPQAAAEEAAIVESHEDALVDSGADAGDKVQDFTNALNGFSAVLSHDEAEALAGTNGEIGRAHV